MLLTVCHSTPSDRLEEHFCTITYDRRPYGVGLMVGGRDVYPLISCNFIGYRERESISSTLRRPATTRSTLSTALELVVRAPEPILIASIWTKKLAWVMSLKMVCMTSIELIRRRDSWEYDYARAGELEGLRTEWWGMGLRTRSLGRSWRRRIALLLLLVLRNLITFWVRRRFRPIWTKSKQTMKKRRRWKSIIKFLDLIVKCLYLSALLLFYSTYLYMNHRVVLNLLSKLISYPDLFQMKTKYWN